MRRKGGHHEKDGHLPAVCAGAAACVRPGDAVWGEVSFGVTDYSPVDFVQNLYR